MIKFKLPSFIKNIINLIQSFFFYICSIVFSPPVATAVTIYVISSGAITLIVIGNCMTYDAPKYELSVSIDGKPSDIKYREDYDRCSKLSGDFIASVVNALPVLYFNWSVDCVDRYTTHDVLNGKLVSSYSIDSIKNILSEDKNVKLASQDDVKNIIIVIGE